jgi:hypothetical protein
MSVCLVVALGGIACRPGPDIVGFDIGSSVCTFTEVYAVCAFLHAALFFVVLCRTLHCEVR